MAAETYEGNYGRRLEIDVCHACNGLWFDGRESMMLTPGSVLKLFSSMHERHTAARASLVEQPRCPRCAGPLKEQTDLMKSARFSYHACPQHGRYTTFFQWMREKGMVRAPSPVELKELRARVQMVNCSNCGAPIPLNETTHCKHCAAPVSILSPESIDATLKELHAKEVDRTTVKPELLFDAMVAGAKVDREMNAFEASVNPYGRRFGGSTGWQGDLLLSGVSGLLSLIRRVVS